VMTEYIGLSYKMTSVIRPLQRGPRAWRMTTYRKNAHLPDLKKVKK